MKSLYGQFLRLHGEGVTEQRRVRRQHGIHARGEIAPNSTEEASTAAFRPGRGRVRKAFFPRCRVFVEPVLKHRWDVVIIRLKDSQRLTTLSDAQGLKTITEPVHDSGSAPEQLKLRRILPAVNRPSSLNCTRTASQRSSAIGNH